MQVSVVKQTLQGGDWKSANSQKRLQLYATDLESHFPVYSYNRNPQCHKGGYEARLIILCEVYYMKTLLIMLISMYLKFCLLALAILNAILLCSKSCLHDYILHICSYHSSSLRTLF